MNNELLKRLSEIPDIAIEDIKEFGSRCFQLQTKDALGNISTLIVRKEEDDRRLYDSPYDPDKTAPFAGRWSPFKSNMWVVAETHDINAYVPENGKKWHWGDSVLFKLQSCKIQDGIITKGSKFLYAVKYKSFVGFDGLNYDGANRELDWERRHPGTIKQLEDSIEDKKAMDKAMEGVALMSDFDNARRGGGDTLMRYLYNNKDKGN